MTAGITLVPGRLVQLDFPYDLPVEYKQHIRDHPEHENLDTDDDEKHRENGQRDMFDMAKPFQQDINTGRIRSRVVNRPMMPK